MDALQGTAGTDAADLGLQEYREKNLESPNAKVNFARAADEIFGNNDQVVTLDELQAAATGLIDSSQGKPVETTRGSDKATNGIDYLSKQVDAYGDGDGMVTATEFREILTEIRDDIKEALGELDVSIEGLTR